MREARVENYFVRKVKAAGGDARKLKWPGRRHAPDRMVLWSYHHDLVELKKPGEKARAGQIREHERLRRAGFTLHVLDTLEKVDRYVEGRAR